MQVTETVTKSKTCLNPKPVNLRVGKVAREQKKIVLTTNQACGKVRHVSQSGWFPSGANFMYLPMENTSANLIWYRG